MDTFFPLILRRNDRYLDRKYMYLNPRFPGISRAEDADWEITIHRGRVSEVIPCRSLDRVTIGV